MSEEEEFEFRLRLEKERGKPGALKSFGAGVGKGVGTVALNAQRFLGKGLAAFPGDAAQAAGGWLTSDAEAGLQKITGEFAPYKAANPMSAGAGEITGNVAATLPVGGLLAKGVGLIPGAGNLASAVGSAGFTGGNVLTRMAGGGITGGASAGLVNPEQAGTGAVIGAVLPPALQAAGKAGQAVGSAVSKTTKKAAERLMQSALKPTAAQLKSGEADTAVQTLLQYGISPTKAGVKKLQGLIDDVNTQIESGIANSTAVIDKQNVLQRLNDTRRTFGQQVAPQGDLAAIQRVGDDFVAHPGFPGNDIPVQIAQMMKQGTYRVLKKKYGQMGSAETEASKGLARGLKEEIATAVPGIGKLNAEESRLLDTLGVAEKRALMDANKNPMGLALLAENPVTWAAFMADRSVAFKALAARLANAASKTPNPLQALAGSPVERLGLRAAPVLVADQ